jgi:hypothetical protein
MKERESKIQDITKFINDDSHTPVTTEQVDWWIGSSADIKTIDGYLYGKSASDGDLVDENPLCSADAGSIIELWDESRQAE